MGKQTTTRTIAQVIRRTLVLLVAALVAYVVWLRLQVPALTGLEEGPAPVSSFMEASAANNGTTASPAPFVALTEVTPLLACAVVKAEDVRFFSHSGFDWPQLWLALRRWGRQGGASTITQQLARNLYLSPERTIHRKLREAFTARELEQTLDKARILELYLNVIPLGPGVWGVHAASHHYFHKHPRQLTVFEAVFLSGVIAAPNATLTGSQLLRVQTTTTRVVGALDRSGLLAAGEREHVERQIHVLVASLEAGAELTDALARASSTGAPSTAPVHAHPRQATTPLPLENAIAEACGYAREVTAPET